MPVYVWAGVAGLGGVGAIARFLIDASISSRLESDFPWGTYAINMAGSFVLGALGGAGLSGYGLVLEGTATIGAFTTFSTWMLETHRLGEDDDRRFFAANIVGSLLVGLLAAYLGQKAGQHL